MDRRTFIGTAAAVAAIGAPEVKAATGPMLAFVHEGVPVTPKGSCRCFIVVAQREGKKPYVTPAYYLHGFELDYEDCHCENEDDHMDGCPTTGWFRDESNLEYEHCYWDFDDKILAWAPLPSADDVVGTVSLPKATEVGADADARDVGMA